MDAMSEAIEGADVMLYGVSRAYKESANVRRQAVLIFMRHLSYMACSPCVSTTMNGQCRLEANYAHQQELDMIPLMMQKDYKPQGWRKSERQVLHWLIANRNVADAEAFCADSRPDHGNALMVRRPVCFR